MSKYTRYYNARQETYRNMALAWNAWRSGGRPLSEDQVKGMEYFFRSIGKRFGLLTEFKKIGVI